MTCHYSLTLTEIDISTTFKHFHMRMRIRFFIIWIMTLLRGNQGTVPVQSILSFRVMPWDCVLRYMGNDRYHCFMDLGRMDLAFRLGWIRTIRKHKLQPHVVGCFVRHYLPLRLFDRFVLRTYLVHTNGVSVWMAHHFEKNGTIYYSAISKHAALSGSQIFRLDHFGFQKRMQKWPYRMNKNVHQLFNQGNSILKQLASGPF